MDKLRMSNWLLLSAALYAAAMVLAGLSLLPQVQIILWKLGHITVAGFIGYRLDRAAFRDRLTPESDPLRQIRRAMIIIGAMIAAALGM